MVSVSKQTQNQCPQHIEFKTKIWPWQVSVMVVDISYFISPESYPLRNTSAFHFLRFLWLSQTSPLPPPHQHLCCHHNHHRGSVQFSHSVVSDSLWPHELQHTRPPCPSPTPRACSTHVCRVGDVIQPSHPLPSPVPLAFNLFQHQGLFQWVSSSHQVAKVMELQL